MFRARIMILGVKGGGGAGVFFVLWRVDPLRDHGCVNIDSVRLASGLVSTRTSSQHMVKYYTPTLGAEQRRQSSHMVINEIPRQFHIPGNS